MVDMDEWRASLTEYRIAWITAFSGIALILLVSTWPELFTIRQDQTRPERAEATTSPAKEAQAHKPLLEKQDVSKEPEKKVAIEQPKPKIIDAHKAPVTSKKTASAPVKKPQAKPAAPGSGYYVQTGAFKDAAGAKKVADKISQHGWPAIVVPKGKLYAVWAGPKQSRDAIEKLQQEIQRGLNIKGFIVQKKPS